MKTKQLLIVMLGMFAFLSCENNPATTPVITKSVFSGYVQKGPYLNGSSITVTMLDGQLNQIGKVFSTQIIDNSGNFEQRNMEFASQFIEIKTDGYYFDEVKGENSGGSLTLYALADITDADFVNVNILTHLERQRIIWLIQNSGLSFADAKKQAGKEVLGIFKFDTAGDIAAETLNITDDALLLAASVIVQGHLSTGDMSELLANISADIRTDGKLDNPTLGSQLVNNVAYTDHNIVKSNMEEKYGNLGITLNINGDELKTYIDRFLENSGFERTSDITYPETGKYGPNILADGFTEAKATGGAGRFEYSVKAELPAGKSSLNIVIKPKQPKPEPKPEEHDPAMGLWYWGGFNQGSDENWLVTNDISVFTFTAVKSGVSTDASVIFNHDCIVEYYENGATEPTKVKEIKVIE